MGIKSQRKVAEQDINHHRELVNINKESSVKYILLTAYILN